MKKNLSVLLSTIFSITMYAMEQNKIVIVADGPKPKDSIERALNTPAPGLTLAQKCYGGKIKIRKAELDTLGKNIRPAKRTPAIRAACKTRDSMIRHSREALVAKDKKKKAEKKS